MQLTKRIYFLFFVLGCGLFSCNPEIEDDQLKNAFKIEKGEIDPGNYVAIGDEFTAGFYNNELFFSGQNNAYPALISQKLNLLENVQFTFPSMVDELGFGNRLKLGPKVDCNGEEELFIIPFGGEIREENQNNLERSFFNNYAIPQLRVNDLIADDYDNPYWARMQFEASSSVAAHIESLNPSFFTLWLGTNDALSWAKQGGSIFAGNFNVLTPEFIFERNFNRLVDSLAAEGAKGVIATIPNIENFPFFNVIPRNALVLTQEQADDLNFFYLTSPNINFQEGENNFVVRDGLVSRHITEEERILLSVDLDSVKCGRYGSLIPFSSEDVLLTSELAELQNAIDGYNQIIVNAAARNGFPILDMQSFFAQIEQEGVVWDGVDTGYDFITGGFFSLDGIHPTPRGSALIANEFIKVMNAFYDSSLPFENPNDHQGVVLP